jgi:TonB family protein
MANEKQNIGLWFPAVMTFVSHGLVLTFLILFIISTPIPPYPAGGGPGMEVNLGFSDEGMGDFQPDKYNPNPDPFNPNNQTSANNQSSDDNLLTQDYEDAISVKNNPDNKNNVNNSTQTNNQPVINEPRVNPNALYSGNSGGSEGETGNPGDQGNPNGDPNAKNHYGEPGPGDKPGDGGNGNLFTLKDRKIMGGLPKPLYSANQQGKVVVEIYVDRTGKVIKANTGYKGTTISTQALLQAALTAAKQAKFNVDPNAPEVQRGLITYVFELQ